MSKIGSDRLSLRSTGSATGTAPKSGERAKITVVSEGAGGSARVELRGWSCGALERQARALAQWRARLGEAQVPEPQCVARAFGLLGSSIDVTSVLPDGVQRSYGVQNAADGPNCWDEALRATGLATRPPVQAHFSEMHFYTEQSGQCRLRSPAESPRPGDLLAIRGRYASNQAFETHGSVYVTDELVYTKNGTGTEPADRARLEPAEELLESGPFAVAPQCRQREAVVPAARRYAETGVESGDPCAERWMAVYDCTPRGALEAQSPLARAAPEPLATAQAELEVLLADLSRGLTTGARLVETSAERVLALHERLTALEAECRSDPALRLHWERMRAELNALFMSFISGTAQQLSKPR